MATTGKHHNSGKRKPSLEQLAKQTQLAARQRVVNRGIVQFRANPELMDELLRVADYKGLPYGVMVRGWVVERLHEEKAKLLQFEP